MHQFEWNVSHQFASHGTQVEFDASHVGNDETGGFGAFSHDSRRRQIDFVILEVAVEGDAADILVAVEHRSQGESLGHGRSRCDGTSFTGFQTGHALVVMTVDERDFNVLHDGHHDRLDRLLGLVLDIDIETDLVVVVEQFTVQSQLEIQLAARESKTFGHHRARLLGAGRERSELHLNYSNEHTDKKKKDSMGLI